MSGLLKNTSDNDTFSEVSTPKNFIWDLDNCKYKLLDIEGLSVGQEFSGYAYLSALHKIDNKNNSYQIDIVYELVDKNGITFTARQFEVDRSAFEDDLKEGTVVLVESGIAYPNFKSGYNEFYYNINKLRYNEECPNIPLKFFLDSIPDLAEEFKELVETIKSLPTEYYLLLESLTKKYDLASLLKTKPYKNTLGTRLGSTIVMLNRTKRILTSLRPKEEDKLNHLLFTTQYIYEGNRKLIEIENKKLKPTDEKQLVHIGVLQEILSSTLTTTEKQFISKYLHVNPYSQYKNNQISDKNGLILVKILELVERVV